jgi:hypothetical protein
LRNIDDLVDSLLNEKKEKRKKDSSGSGLFHRECMRMFEAGRSVDFVEKELKRSFYDFTAAPRYIEQGRLRQEIERIREKLPEDVHEKYEKPSEVEPIDFKSLVNVEEQDVEWIWYPYLARGELTILEGDPGVGKSYLIEVVGKELCDGGKLPSMRPIYNRRMKVFFFDMENDPAKVLKKRMRWNGCKHQENFHFHDKPFAIDNEAERAAVFDALGKVKPGLVVFDTGNHYTGEFDLNRNAKAAKATAFFLGMAREFNCAVVMLRHLTKAGQKEMTKALYRGQGNIAASGVARIVLTAGYHPEDPSLGVLCVTKVNLAPKPPALIYEIVVLPSNLTEDDPSRFDWGDFDHELTSDSIVLAQPQTKRKPVDAAVELLNELLADGPMAWRDLITTAEKRSISKRTLYRAAKVLGIDRNHKSTWELPKK